MFLDVSTLSLILTITNLLQIIAIFVQYRLNRSRQGLGWWLIGFIAITLGFLAVSLTRDSVTSSNLTLVHNSLFVLGTTFLYVGVLRFLGKRENRPLLIGAGMGFVAALFYLFAVRGDALSGRALFSGAVAVLSMLSGAALLNYRLGPLMKPAHFLAAVFLINGLVFILRGVSSFVPLGFLNTLPPSLQQSATYLIILCVTILWTFGFIILINQSLLAENQEIARNLQLVFRANPDSIVITRLTDNLVIDVNDRFLALTGYHRADVVGKPMQTLRIWQDPAVRAEMIRALEADGEVQAWEANFLRHDGSIFTGSLSARLFLLDNLPHVLAVTRDVTQAKALEQALRESEEKYRFMTEHTGDVIWHLNSDFRFDYVSPSDERMRGIKADQVLGSSVWELIKSDEQEMLNDLNTRLLLNEHNGVQNATLAYEVEVLRKDGSYFWAEVSVTPHFDVSGKLAGLHGITRDITERRRYEDELELLARTDALTGMVNRGRFLEIAAREQRRALCFQHELSLALLDLDHLKRINDEFGHAAGDRMLRVFSEVCRRNIFSGDIVARFGGDEFVMLFPGTASADALQIVERIRQELADTIAAHEGHELRMTISCGLSGLIPDDESVDDLLGRADQALYEAKKGGRNRVSVQQTVGEA